MDEINLEGSRFRELIESAETETAVEIKQAELEQKKKKYDERIIRLRDSIIESKKTRGAEDGLTLLLVSFLDVAIMMRNTMDTMTAINDAMACLTDAITFLDDAIGFDVELMDKSLQKNYGFFARLKYKAKLKKSIKNNVNRMKQIANGLEMKYKMASDISKSFSKIGASLTAISLKSKKSSAKKKAKGGTELTPAEQMIAAREREIAGGVSATESSSVGTSATANSGGIDDII